jgi:hypothetical protein
MTDDKDAIRWIVDLLRDLGVPFQVAGGLAAKAYGARRRLADLDIYIPAGRLEEVAEAAAPHVVRPPIHHRDGQWDLTFMKLEFGGREIELAGADDARYYDRASGCWRPAEIDFHLSVERTVFGIPLPVMPFEQLVAYKRRLGREVDLQDVDEMLSAQPEGETTV